MMSAKISLKNSLLSVVIVLFSAAAGAQSETNESFFSKSRQVDLDGVELYGTNYELKHHKKIGMGLTLGGTNGLIGINSELNLEAQNAVVIGLGTGPSYGSFNLSWKHNFEGRYLSPFSRVGYSKWFSSSNNPSAAKNSDILKRVFSEKDLNSGRFDADFVVGAVGLEYNQLAGDFAGVNIYGEFAAMVESKKTPIIPTGSVGVTYFY